MILNVVFHVYLCVKISNLDVKNNITKSLESKIFKI